MTPLIIGNWKLNPKTSRDAHKLFLAVSKKIKKNTADVVVAPPFPFIAELARLSPAGRPMLSAQDLFYEDQGAYTGEVSAPMLASLGVAYVIVGHSERRARGESDEEVRKKIGAALKHKLLPVVCIGERERDEGGVFYSSIESQVRAASQGLSSRALARITFAYEPLWAIGTGRNAAAEDIKEMQLFITSVLAKRFERAAAQKVRLLYGGSVTAGNAKTLHQEGGMNGFLVGEASLSPDSFADIVAATL
jgi:triosephosphate isomerase